MKDKLKKMWTYIVAYTPIGTITFVITFLLADLFNLLPFEINYFEVLVNIFILIYHKVIIWLANYVSNYEPLFKYLIYWIYTILIFVFVTRILPSFCKLLFKCFTIMLSFPFTDERNSQKILVKNYFYSLSYFGKWWNVLEILKSHLIFLMDILMDEHQITDKELLVYRASYENKGKIIKLNRVLTEHIWKSNYLRKEAVSIEWFFYSYVAKGSMTRENLKSKLLGISDEIISILWENYKMNIILEGHDDVKIELIDSKTLWESKTINLDKIKLKKWDILLWFYPIVSKSWIKLSNYIINSKDLLHTAIIWATKSWKDVVMRNIIFSIINHIKQSHPVELHFFDTKESDGNYLSNLRSYRIFRYSEIQKYGEILKKLCENMSERQKILWNYSEYEDYNRNNEKKMNEKFIIINEIPSLLISPSIDGTLISWYINDLLAKWRAVGIKVFLMSQTIRKDLNKHMGALLSNISWRMLLEQNNEEEVEISGRELSKADRKRITNIEKYNCFYIEDSVIKKEFKAYNISKSDLLEYLKDNFERIEIFEDQKLNNYLLYAKKLNKISMQTAKNDFGFSDNDWKKFIEKLKERGLVDRKKWDKYYFK